MGHFLDPFVINYSVSAFWDRDPAHSSLHHGQDQRRCHGGSTQTFLAAFLVPLLLYRLAWAWWLMIYYFFLPQNIPGNLEGRPDDDE